VIRSFKDKRAKAIFDGQFVKGLDGQIQQRAREKLKYLDAAANLGDLRVPPGNQLEALKGASASTNSGASAFCGKTAKRWTWRSSTTIDSERVFKHGI
jgi:plasmid maintenance system killer protein